MAEPDGPKPVRQDPWGVAPGTRVWSGGHHEAAKKLLLAQLTGVTRPRHGLIDVGFLAPASVDEAAYFAGKIIPRLKPPATMWIVLPDVGTAHAAGFGGSVEALRAAMEERGLVLRQTAAIGDGFLAAKFQAAEG
jgi:hypothetical protein